MYRIAVDVGGTFTDFIATSPGGEILEAKVPSNRREPDVAFRTGLQDLADHAGVSTAEALLAQTSMVIQGTTVAINAVLQTNGAKTGLLCTKGFRDTLEIRLGWKEERYLFNYVPPEVLVPRHLRLPIGGRITADGSEFEPLDEDEIHRAADALLAEQVEAVAVCYLWSFANPSHERRTRAILEQRLPGVYITTSHDILPRIREYNRTSTTVLDAYIGPIVHRHIARTERILRDLGFTGRVRYVQSNGGLAEAEQVRKRPILLLVSGPAAAPSAGRQFPSLAGDDFITIDMGGTSFDTCLVRNGLPEMRNVSDLNGYRVATALVDVHAIGAGGGSIARLDHGLVLVGPESAEAVPGPACYMRGGTRPTVTDANVVCGFIGERGLLGGGFALDTAAARTAVAEHLCAGTDLDPQVAAAGMLEVVNRSMADAMREISVQRGHDPRDFAMIVGGGAGGLHAAQLADELGMSRIVVPRAASELCAFGAVFADVRHDYTQAVVARTSNLDVNALADTFRNLEAKGRGDLEAEGIEPQEMSFHRSVEMRYDNQVWEVEIDLAGLDLDGEVDAVRAELEARFHRRHEELYAFSQAEDHCEMVACTVTALGASPRRVFPHPGQPAAGAATPSTRREARFHRNDAPLDTAIYDGTAIVHGQFLEGPAVIEEPNTTIVVPPGWRAEYHGGEQAYLLTNAANAANTATAHHEGVSK